jgi:Fic family protein
MDGNGRTGRLLATLLLHRGGFGLRGFFSLEEYHARDLAAYYANLQAHDHHNYYFGRADVDLTTWLEYFITGVAHVFTVAEEEALRLAERGVPAEPEAVRRLDARARRVLALFSQQREITASDVGRLFPLGDRMVRHLIRRWVEDGLLVIVNASKRGRRYGIVGNLSAVHRRVIGNGVRLTRKLLRPTRGA